MPVDTAQCVGERVVRLELGVELARGLELDERRLCVVVAEGELAQACPRPRTYPHGRRVLRCLCIEPLGRLEIVEPKRRFRLGERIVVLTDLLGQALRQPALRDVQATRQLVHDLKRRRPVAALDVGEVADGATREGEIAQSQSGPRPSLP